jgi:5-methylthioadenosine/S-adenosylhomocysteine deaminase
MSILIKNARILSMDSQFNEYEKADIFIEGNQIHSIGPSLSIPENLPDLRIIDAAGMLAMPGLINGHLHSPGNFLKGALDSMPLEIFMLYEVPPLFNSIQDPRFIYARTLLGAIEMLKLGITSVIDDAYYVPSPLPDSIDSLMAAYADSGIRASVSIDQPNVIEYEKYPFLADILPEKIRQQMSHASINTSDQLLECYQHLISRWHDTFDGRIRAAVSVSAPQRVTTEYFQSLSDLSKKIDAPFIVHILETKLQRILGDVKYKRSLVKYTHDLGVLDEHMLIIHAIWVDDEDVRLIANAGCSVAHNPVCNLRLGSGVMTFRRFKDYGIPLCLGTDEACSDDTANLWGVAKVAGLIHTITEIDYRLWPKAKEILFAATRGGARAMRYTDKLGALLPGYQADLILLDLDALAFIPLNDIYRQLIYCENGTSVKMTIVAGKVIVDNGKVLSVNEQALKIEIREHMEKYKHDISAITEIAKNLEPYYREMYLKAAATDVEMNRWILQT